MKAKVNRNRASCSSVNANMRNACTSNSTATVATTTGGTLKIGSRESVTSKHLRSADIGRRFRPGKPNPPSAKRDQKYKRESDPPSLLHPFARFNADVKRPGRPPVINLASRYERAARDSRRP